MNYRELRIGNCVTFNEANQPFVVDEVYEDSCLLHPLKAPSESSFTTIQPIKLTNAILINLGFRDLGYGEFELGNYMCDGEYTDHNEYEFCYLGKRLCTVYFMHQLQNVYFALTGEELTYA